MPSIIACKLFGSNSRKSLTVPERSVSSSGLSGGAIEHGAAVKSVAHDSGHAFDASSFATCLICWEASR